MAADNKTEKATPKRRSEERKKGNISRSQDLSIFLSLASLSVIIFFYIKPMTLEITKTMDGLFQLILDNSHPRDLLIYSMGELVRIFIPIVMIVTVFQILNYVLQVRFLFSMQILKPDFKRLNPLGYFKNIVSRKKAIDIIKYFIMMAILIWIAYIAIKSKIEGLLPSIVNPWGQTTFSIYGSLKVLMVAVLIGLFFIAIFDFVYQKWEFEQKIKMSKDDVKQERKSNEGNPEVKGRQRQFMYALLQKDVTAKIPEATVIINNPTHISVALRYKKGIDNVPVLLAKGEEELALYIRRLAKEHNIPMLENKPLARSIYYTLEPGDEIEEEMYEAVAEVLRYLVETKQIEL